MFPGVFNPKIQSQKDIERENSSNRGSKRFKRAIMANEYDYDSVIRKSNLSEFKVFGNEQPNPVNERSFNYEKRKNTFNPSEEQDVKMNLNFGRSNFQNEYEERFRRGHKRSIEMNSKNIIKLREFLQVNGDMRNSNQDADETPYV